MLVHLGPWAGGVPCKSKAFEAGMPWKQAGALVFSENKWCKLYPPLRIHGSKIAGHENTQRQLLRSCDGGYCGLIATLS